MANKVFIRFVSAVIALFLTCAVANPLVCAVGSSADYMTVDSITICERHGIVEGEKIKLIASLMPETAFESSVKWRSSNESVVSCTEDGLIKGITPGEYAYIYCESKWGDVSDKIKVYCVEKVSRTVRSNLKGYVNFIYSAPNPLAFLALHVNRDGMLKLISYAYNLAVSGLYSASTVNAATGVPLAMGKCEIRGKSGSYAYISFKSGEIERDGFIQFSRFEETAGLYPTLSAKDMNVWGDGVIYESKILTTQYAGDVTWEVADDTVVKFNDKTGQVTGLKPGVTTITATTSDGLSETCTVHSLYKWPQTWTTQTNRDTYLYRADGYEYKEDKALVKGNSFVVYGDEGGSDGWAYGNISGTETWGYIPISHISTKGTVSQYRNLKTTLNGLEVPWIWPVRDTKNGVVQSSTATYVSSPYGKRDVEGSTMHKGIDITTGYPGEIKGYDVVSACSGKVVYVGSNKNSDFGYCLSIRSDEKDPVTGLYYVVTYMHLETLPVVRINDYVTANQVLGYVGNTSSNTKMGYHLHFEINCKNSSINDGSGTRNSYDNLINPIFIFVDKCVIGTASDKKDGIVVINQTSDAVSKYRGAYWYGDNTGKENNQ